MNNDQYKKFLELKKKQNEDGQVQESQQKQYQAKEYFGKGANAAHSPSTSNAMGVRMSEGGIVSTSANTASSLSPLLKETYYSKKKDKIPKRSRPIDIFKGYANGGNVEDLLQKDPPLTEQEFTKPGEDIPQDAGILDFFKYNLSHFDPNDPGNLMGMAGTTSGIAKSGVKALASKLPSRALSQEEAEIADDLLKGSPSMKTQALEEQADLYSKASDVPQEIREGLNPQNFELKGEPYTPLDKFELKGQPYKNPNLPTVSTSREVLESTPLQSLEREVSPLSTPKDILVPKNIPGSMDPGMSKLTKTGILGAAGLTGGGIFSIPPEIKQKIVKDEPLHTNDIDKIVATLPAPKKHESTTKSVEKLSAKQKPESSNKTASETPAEASVEAQPTAPSNILDVGNQGYDPIQALKDAQDHQRTANLWNTIGGITERGAAQYGGYKPTQQEAYKENIAASQQGVDNVKDRIKQQGDDPSSPMAKAFKSYLEKFSGQKIVGDLTPNMGKELLPVVFKDFEAKQALAESSRKSKEALSAEERKYKFLADERRFIAGENAKNRTATQATKADEKKEKLAQSFRKEATTGKLGDLYANYLQADRIGGALAEFKKNPSGYSDYATLMGGLKALQGDQSVVRETEIRLGTNATSAFNKVENYIQQLATGKSLQPSQREEMVRVIDVLSNVGKDIYKKATSPIAKQVKKHKIPLNEVFYEGLHVDDQELSPGDKEAPTTKSMETSKTIIKKGYNAKSNKTQFIYSDGTSEIKDGKL